MKKYFVKALALLLFTSVAISSCSMEYRENRKKRDDARRHDHGYQNRDNDNRNHNY